MNNHADAEVGTKTRMIFMGESALADGFRLIGFEVWVAPAIEEMERVLRQLIDRRQKAFVVLGRDWVRSESPVLRAVEEEGGRIVVTGIPPLHDPQHFHCNIDARISAMFGPEDSAKG